MLHVACLMALSSCLPAANAAAAAAAAPAAGGAVPNDITPAMDAAARRDAVRKLQAALERTAGSGSIAEQVLACDVAVAYDTAGHAHDPMQSAPQLSCGQYSCARRLQRAG